jgi:hypothetical protein
MALILADRVRETTTTTGQGTITLDGAVTGFRSFATVGNANTTYYVIAGQGTSEWEVGIGTYTSSGTTLSRDTVLSSSAGGTTKTTFSAGTKDVWVDYPAGKAVYQDTNSIASAPVFQASNGIFVNNTTISSSYTIATGTNGQSIGPVTIASGAAVTVSSGQRWVVL